MFALVENRLIIASQARDEVLSVPVPTGVCNYEHRPENRA